jgi:hypothetical protein
MRRHIKMNESTAVMFDANEHVQNSERAGHRDTEITRDDGARMITKEARPPLISVRPSWRPDHWIRYQISRPMMENALGTP